MIEDISSEEPAYPITQANARQALAPQGAVVIDTSRDPIPDGPVGWVMKLSGIKRVRTARIVGGTFLALIAGAATAIVIREYFIVFTVNPVPETTPLVRDLPVIE